MITAIYSIHCCIRTKGGSEGKIIYRYILYLILFKYLKVYYDH